MKQRGKVLIVDDSPMNVDVLRRILREEYELESAASGEECLAKLFAFRPQMVLLDIMMPGMDGYETCRRIKSGPLGDSLHVILVSGKGTAADRVHGYEVLADDYVVKPFDHDELHSKVRAHFRLMNLRADAEAPESRQALARLCGLVMQMSTDINEHTTLIDEIQGELLAAADESVDALIHATVRLANTNKATQGRLASAERKLREQAQEIESHASEARTDAITLLPNRRAFDEELLRRTAEAGGVGGNTWAVMIDIDRFKHLNDEYGHLAGDEVLRATGRVLRSVIRSGDFVARYGGDEFAALLTTDSWEDARCGAMRIREAIENAVIHYEDRLLRITASVGIAARLPGEDRLLLIKRADDALYVSKKASRNCIHWHDGNETNAVAGSLLSLGASADLALEATLVGA